MSPAEDMALRRTVWAQRALELSLERDVLAEQCAYWKKLHELLSDAAEKEVATLKAALSQERERSTRMHRRAQMAESACGQWKEFLARPQCTGRFYPAISRLCLMQMKERIEALEKAGMMLRNCLCFDNQDLNAAMVAWENATK